MRWIFVNGKLIERSAARVSAQDRGLLYGYGLFETMRSYDGRVFRLEEHYRRLCDGASRLAMAVPLSLGDVGEAVDAVLKRNDLADAYLRLTVTAGQPPDVAGPTEDSSVVLTAGPLTDYPPEMYRRGVSAVVSSVRRNETSPLARVKSLNYLDNLLAREDARRRGADEAILLNTRGKVAEGSAVNLFLVEGHRLLTPGIESGALPGITRQAVLELAADAGMEAVESSEIETQMLHDASEAFLTNSVMEV
ncbi:MAG: aminotransferase class IV, partial [Dehalococcoidia bacterium]